MEMEKAYNPGSVEHKIYERWQKSGYFNPDKLPGKRGKAYTIIMPPSNANAAPHVGHALGFTIQDILIRFHRMLGDKTLYLPGTDHAGFETQVVFEKKLEKEGRSRFKMQREEFYKEIWDYVQENKEITEESIRRLGVSCDWSRNIFTLDPEIVKIVYQTFEQMHKDNLVFRGNRIGNWCTKHQTALSDLETKHEEREDPLYYIKYGPLELATVRPETKFGDTGVAVNPNDKRYQKYIGKEVEIETLLGKAKIKVIADTAVDPDFGTGVIKVTPAHDPADFDIWQRHKDEIPGPKQVIDKFGKLNDLTGPYEGLKIKTAREKIVADMEKAGLLNPKKTEHHYKHNVQICYKCGTVIEPLIIPQWFVAMTKPLPDGRPSLRDMAVAAVKKGEVKFVSERFEKIFMHWMENIRDWPISRQIWWGIPIPVWYCGGSEKTRDQIMGFHESIAPEVLKGKVRTYRLREHGLKIGDRVVFENSQSKFLFGHAIITNIIKTTVEKIALPDALHGNKYKTTEELIQAFKRLHPDKKVIKSTPVWIYDYQFTPLSEKDKETGCGQMIVSEKKPKNCTACGGKKLIQDPDTFDTWFSSGQWPYATILANDFKNKTKTFEHNYPTQVMETAWDILFFWVARMIMFSYYRTGKPPFETVFLHGLVRDKDRQKMSKSKGNVIDPLGVIDTYGTDALRFALIFSTAAGNDIPLSEDKIKGMKHFANKLWNISRYVLTNITISNFQFPISKPHPRTEADRKILTELDNTIESVTKNLENFRLHEAAQEIYYFTWHELADVYIEASKEQLKNEKLKEDTLFTLYYLLITVLKLLHPFMPFITEELWSKLHSANLVGDDPMLMVSKWPGPHK